MIRTIIKRIINVIREEYAYFKLRLWLKRRAVRWAR
jgi:hypothetical protein